MTHVVTEPCVDCQYTDCVSVCPTDAFREGERMLYIDPEACIDCYNCIPECPVEAIFQEDDVPERWKGYTALNAELAATSPEITERREPLKECGG